MARSHAYTNPGPKSRSCRRTATDVPGPHRRPLFAVWGSPLQGQAASSNQHMEFDILLSYWAHLPPHPGPISPRYSPWVSTDHFELTGHQPILLIL